MSKSKQAEASLAEELPYWEFFDKPRAHVVLADGAIVGGISLSLNDIECLDESEVNQFTMTLRSSLDSLSEGITAQFVFQVRSDFSDVLESHRKGWQTNAHPLLRTIAEKRHRALQAAQETQELYRPSLLVYLRTPAVLPKHQRFWKKSSDFSQAAESAYEDTLETLVQNLDNLQSSFQAAGLSCRALTQGEIVANVYGFLNPKRARTEPTPSLIATAESELDRDTLEDAAWLASQSPREQLAFGDLILGFEQFTLDSHHHKVITLKTLPEITYAGQLASFLRMPFHYDFILSFAIPPQASEMAKLQQKRKMAHSLAVTHGGKASDLESESKLSSAEELIRELLQTGQRIYAVQATMVLRAPATPEGVKRLNRQTREVLSRFRTLQGAEGLEESVGAWKVVKGNLPAAPIHLERARKMKTHNLADFLPVYGPREGDRDPVVLFRNRLNGLVSFDPFDPGLPNYNTLVTGSSGAGKSFLFNCILLQQMTRNIRVFIIDIGGSYRKITEALGGQYIEFGLTNGCRINPFALPEGTDTPSDQKLKSLLATVEMMVSDDSSARLQRLDRVRLEQCLVELYREFSAKKANPKLSDLAALLRKHGEASMRSLGELLYPWTGDRPYGRVLDTEGNLDPRAKICAFDLRQLSGHPDLQGVVTLLLTDFITGEVARDKETRKEIVLDEVWAQMRIAAAASFMEDFARTARKTGTGITFITQGVEEIVASPIGPAILNNTATKFVMLQRGDSEVLCQTLKLNSQELSLIQSLSQRKGEFSEGFMIEGDHRQVIRVFPSAVEYWLSTSDAQDNKYLESLTAGGLTLVAAIEKAAQVYPKGVAYGPVEEKCVA